MSEENEVHAIEPNSYHPNAAEKALFFLLSMLDELLRQEGEDRVESALISDARRVADEMAAPRRLCVNVVRQALCAARLAGVKLKGRTGLEGAMKPRVDTNSLDGRPYDVLAHPPDEPWPLWPASHFPDMTYEVPLHLRAVDVPTVRAFRDRVAEKLDELRDADEERFLKSRGLGVSPPADAATHSPDFTTLEYRGTRYTFKKGNQAEAVRALWGAHGHSLTRETIRKQINSGDEKFRMSKLFSGHPAWGTLIVTDGKGCYHIPQ